jgi:hypothetical protein
MVLEAERVRGAAARRADEQRALDGGADFVQAGRDADVLAFAVNLTRRCRLENTVVTN